MKREKKCVAYSYEHGNKSLPHLKDLVSDKPDAEKKKIIEYLETHCVTACGGIIKDEICNENTIGHGNIFSDGTYYWNDVFINYVDRYNIPVPKEFREHILNNYSARMKRHMLLRMVNRVEIQNNPYLGYQYSICIHKNGIVNYKNNIDYTDSIDINVSAENTEWFIDPIMSELFCYDSDNHGTPVIDGYHWKITFFNGMNVIDEIEGWNGEDIWRYCKFSRIIEFIERYIKKSLGSEYMTDYKDDSDFYKILQSIK